LTVTTSAEAANCKKGQPCGNSCISWDKLGAEFARRQGSAERDHRPRRRPPDSNVPARSCPSSGVQPAAVPLRE
jgi:hypothetical protein